MSTPRRLPSASSPAFDTSRSRPPANSLKPGRYSPPAQRSSPSNSPLIKSPHSISFGAPSTPSCAFPSPPCSLTGLPRNSLPPSNSSPRFSEPPSPSPPIPAKPLSAPQSLHLPSPSPTSPSASPRTLSPSSYHAPPPATPPPPAPSRSLWSQLSCFLRAQ